MGTARSLLSYGSWYWISGVISFVVLQYDKFIVGTLRGTASLGIYERAYTYAQMPTGVVTHAIAGITGSVYARYQNDRRELSAAFSKIFGIILRVSAPVALILFVQAESLTRLLLPGVWLDMGAILRWLVVYSFLRPLLDDVYALLLAVGQPRRVTRLNAVQAVLLLVLMPVLTCEFGLKGAASSVNIMIAAGVYLALRYTSYCVDVPWKRMAIPPLVGVLIAGAACPFFVNSAPFDSVWINLGVEVGLMAAFYAAALFAMEGRRLIHECRQLYALFQERRETAG